MADYGHDLEFGIFVTPVADQASGVVELAKEADVLGLDYVTFQDHPYQAKFLDSWTLLASLAGETSNVRLALNVANLPLRPPAVLARSVASLDVISGGRAELGLGAGAFWEAIEAMGGRRLTPGQGVDQLTEAIEVIRAFWNMEGRSIRFEGEYYTVNGAHPGPAPVHPIGIWLGAYKPRMLALTGAKANGWVPSVGYADPPELPAMNDRIDEAARAAGRDPGEIRRMYNLLADPGSDSGWPRGEPGDWPEQLAELTLEVGMSSYILSVGDASQLRVFAEEVAPATRELVEAARARGTGGTGDHPEAEEAPPEGAVEQPGGTAGVRGGAGTPFASVATPDGPRLSSEQVWDDETRPSGPARDPDRLYSPDEQAAGKHLIDVHDALRQELEQLRGLVAQVEQGKVEADEVRSYINRMTIRQNNWTLGVYCESYCRVVTGHHTLEDRSVFPHLRRSVPELTPVLDRLGDEHEVITELLDRLDEALVALVAGESGGMGEVRQAVDLLTDALRSHFSYEERELIEPLARVGFY
ncbi:MAG: LLM class flavin-dependent oxidoreductase [Solirubrobacterales bacterium]|nr:LLM class flavin-dependent oxidoreductase [Solirubrobacterales bacterium]OJU94658.1 MAG: 5,10-methylene tetrahydromethanopterin reductase [Solirubrobacterales bacterium 67-14]